MKFVDIHNGIAFLTKSLHHVLQPFLKFATILRSGHHTSQVQFVNPVSDEAFRHLSAFYAGGQSIGQSGLSHARFAHVQRVVLVLSAEHPDGALHFLFAADERIMLFHQIVQAYHHATPRLRFGCFFIRIIAFGGGIRYFQILDGRIFRNQLAEELRFLSVDASLQQIIGLRILKCQQSLYQMRYVYRVLIGMFRHKTSHLDQLGGLDGNLQFIVYSLRYRFHFVVQIIIQSH